MRNISSKKSLFILLCIISVISTACSKPQVQNKKEKSEEPRQCVVKNTKTVQTETGNPLLESQIKELIQPLIDQSSQVAVSVQKLSDENILSIGNQQMEAASLIKLFIAGSVYENQDLLMSQSGDFERLELYLKRMISVSDNESANLLVQKLGNGDSEKGMEIVNEYCQNHGYQETHMGRLLLASNENDDNYTSVNDCNKFLKEIYSGSLSGSEKILEYMKEQSRVGKIPAGLPSGIESANKTGELADVENDVAIVFCGENTYALSVMTSSVKVPGMAREIISDISSVVYETYK